MGMIERRPLFDFCISYSSFQGFDVRAPEGIEVTEIYAYIKRKDDDDDQAMSEFPRSKFEGKAAFNMDYASSEFEYLVIGFNGEELVAFYRADASTLQNLDRINLIQWTD